MECNCLFIAWEEKQRLGIKMSHTHFLRLEFRFGTLGGAYWCWHSKKAMTHHFRAITPEIPLILRTGNCPLWRQLLFNMAKDASHATFVGVHGVGLLIIFPVMWECSMASFYLACKVSKISLFFYLRAVTRSRIWYRTKQHHFNFECLFL